MFRAIGLVLVSIVLFLLFLFRPLTVGPPSIDTGHPFNAQRAYGYLERLLGDETPHPVDSDAGDVVRERLTDLISELGFSPIVSDQTHCSSGFGGLRCARVQNVMFWVGDAGPNAVMLASHHDSVPAGPGASDDGSGVAASLEIASYLKTKTLKRPVLVLITDGEESGLIGAAAFVENNPIAQLINAVVSIEARGVRGPAAMFETSIPNGRDIAVLNAGVKKPISNSLAADVYAAMPNGTDVTEYLKLGVDAGNYAIGGGVQFYHTPGDNLANMDKRSFFHIGANALEAMEAFIEQDGDEPEGQWIYTDVFGLFVIALPQAVSLPLFALAGLGILIVFVTRSGAPIRSALLPLAAVVAGVGIAFFFSWFVGEIRPEAQFAAAVPIALRGSQIAAALFGALIAISLMAKPGSEDRILMASWFWLCLLGGALSFFFPGAAIIFVPALIVLIPALLLYLLGKDGLGQPVAMLAGLIFMLTVVPLTAMGELMLFLEAAAPFTLFTVFSLLVLAPFFMDKDRAQYERYLGITGAMGAAALALTASALFVPAYSPETPRALSIYHRLGEVPGQASWYTSSRDPIPDEMQAIAPFSFRPVYPLGGNRQAADAPDFETAGITAEVMTDTVSDEARTLTVRIAAPDIDRLIVRNRTENVSLKTLGISGASGDTTDAQYIVCYGRNCRATIIEVSVPVDTERLSLEFDGWRFGLGPESQALLSVRPDWSMPIQAGDVRIITTDLDVELN
ncbi:MAG: M20/M25/M40 family metallo-hydrolase [Pseudomonadota bacterium]